MTVKDQAGNILDREVEYFQLGARKGDIVFFDATPGRFEVGEEILFSLEFENTGSEPFSGNIMVNVKNSEGINVKNYNEPFEEIGPGEIVLFEKAWDSSGTEKDDYSVTGYVAHSGGVSEPRQLRISSSGSQGIILY